MAVALADKLDTLAGIFAIGQKPSGTKDPFAIRLDREIEQSAVHVQEQCASVVQRGWRRAAKGVPP